MTHRTHRRVWLLLTFAGLLGFAGWAWWRMSPWTPTPEDADRIEAVEVWLYPWDGVGSPSVPTNTLTVTDREAIRRLLAASRPTGSAQPHKCGDAGHFLFIRTDGKRSQVGFLPGHDPGFYELRPPGEWVQVPRGEFLAAVKATGVAKFPIDCQKPPEPIP